MDYGIYENEPTQMVTLHRSSCRHYKNRKGKTPNGEWYLFFSTKLQAYLQLWAIANAINVGTNFCKKCKP